ncbi:hypothetical protein [Wenzhouxiangella sp. EGI_FJ10409]|uniref:hypothetical protein n=1 Tax=Wenzhouxiangella sp. EGI_FJ10409 TaxID=3243767 RepID=UPI0035DEB76D
MFQKPLQIGLLTALFGLAPLLAQDRIFTDGFQAETIANIRGLEEGFEGMRLVQARVCDYESTGIDEVRLRYRAVGGDPNWSEVLLMPSSGSTSTGAVCQEHEAASEISFEYATILEDNGQLEWQFDVYRSNSTIETYPDGLTGTTKYWANEETAQQAIEGNLNSNPSVYVFCYDCNINLNSDTEGPYDSNFAITNETNHLVAVEYNGERRVKERMVELKTFYHSPDNDRYFFEVNIGSVKSIHSSLDSFIISFL